MQPLLTIDKVYSMVLPEEKQRELVVLKEVMCVDGCKDNKVS